MAVSDPTTAVPTPTGALQGVAAFSWDGSVWQPAGRAGPGVATPTGVLQGVAPFSWDGSAWQPVGRARAGVPTPTGVLDGVAVYTWSGSAWTPVGGTAAPSTPSGALRGVAAFIWDGSAWQPAAQAGPSVPTPYGVLDGVAMFNWNGSAWTAGSALPAGATLDLSFMTPGTLDPRITFTRASTGTYFDAAGVMQTATTNTPRWDYDPVTHVLRGLLIEEARTNSIRNSTMQGVVPGTPGTLPTNWALNTGASGLSSQIVGSGTESGIPYFDFRFFGTAAAGQFQILTETTTGVAALTGQVWTYSQYWSLVGGTLTANVVRPMQVTLRENTSGGALVRDNLLNLPTPVVGALNAQKFTATATLSGGGTTAALGPRILIGFGAGAVDFTLRIGVLQVEQGAFPTSYIPTTAASVTRASDNASIPTAAWFNATNGTYQGEFMPNGNAAGLPIIISGNAGSPTLATGADSRLTAGVRSGAAVFSATGPLYAFGAVNKAAFTYLSGASLAATNGTAFGPSATALTVTGTVVEFGSDGVTPGSNALNGYIRRVRYWPRALTNAELQSVTT